MAPAALRRGMKLRAKAWLRYSATHAARPAAAGRAATQQTSVAPSSSSREQHAARIGTLHEEIGGRRAAARAHSTPAARRLRSRSTSTAERLRRPSRCGTQHRQTRGRATPLNTRVANAAAADAGLSPDRPMRCPETSTRSRRQPWRRGCAAGRRAAFGPRALPRVAFSRLATGVPQPAARHRRPHSPASTCRNSRARAAPARNAMLQPGLDALPHPGQCSAAGAAPPSGLGRLKLSNAATRPELVYALRLQGAELQHLRMPFLTARPTRRAHGVDGRTAAWPK